MFALHSHRLNNTTCFEDFFFASCMPVHPLCAVYNSDTSIIDTEYPIFQKWVWLCAIWIVTVVSSVMWCCAVLGERFVCFKRSYCLHLQSTASLWRSRHYVPLKCQKFVTQQHSITLQRTLFIWMWLFCTGRQYRHKYYCYACVVNVCHIHSRCSEVLCKVVSDAW